MSSKFFEELSAATDDRPEMLEKPSIGGGKLYQVRGSTVWMSTENGAREAYKAQKAVGTIK